jgi:hypothetical protein
MFDQGWAIERIYSMGRTLSTAGSARVELDPIYAFLFTFLIRHNDPFFATSRFIRAHKSPQ